MVVSDSVSTVLCICTEFIRVKLEFETVVKTHVTMIAVQTESAETSRKLRNKAE